MIIHELVGKISYAPNRPVGVVFTGPMVIDGREGNIAVIEWRNPDMEPFIALRTDCCRANISEKQCTDCGNVATWGGEPIQGLVMGFQQELNEIGPFIGVDYSEFVTELDRVHRWCLSCPMVPDWEEGVVPWAVAAVGVGGESWTPIL